MRPRVHLCSGGMSTRPLSPSSMRVARPVSQIPATLRFYVDILGLEQLGEFAGHSGYDGAFVGRAGSDWHIELTRHESGMPVPSPTEEASSCSMSRWTNSRRLARAWLTPDSDQFTMRTLTGPTLALSFAATPTDT